MTLQFHKNKIFKKKCLFTSFLISANIGYTLNQKLSDVLKTVVPSDWLIALFEEAKFGPHGPFLK